MMADNEALSPPAVIDSRSFGPLPLANIVGRCGRAGTGRALGVLLLPPLLPSCLPPTHCRCHCCLPARRPPTTTHPLPPTPCRPPPPPPLPPPHRILYTARSEADHGPVENSEAALAADAPVLEAELDVERLCSE